MLYVFLKAGTNFEIFQAVFGLHNVLIYNITLIYVPTTDPKTRTGAAILTLPGDKVIKSFFFPPKTDTQASEFCVARRQN
jgi:hypothetical protein